MSKEKEKAGDTPEELNMLFRKNRIYMLDFEHRTRKMYAYAYAAAASENDVKRVEERLIELQLRKNARKKGLMKNLKSCRDCMICGSEAQKKDMCK